MRVLLQRVLDASVIVDGDCVGKIGQGLLLYLGIHEKDTDISLSYLADKVLGLRIYPNSEDKMDKSVQDVGGEVLIVSQFTLYGDCRKGRRPAFTEAARPEKAIPMYEQFIKLCKATLGEDRVSTGIFGAKMEVRATNDGPINLLIEHS